MANRVEITDDFEALDAVAGGSFISAKDKVNGGYKVKGGYTGRKFHIANADRYDDYHELLMNFPDTAEGENAIIAAALNRGIFDFEF